MYSTVSIGDTYFLDTPGNPCILYLLIVALAAFLALSVTQVFVDEIDLSKPIAIAALFILAPLGWWVAWDYRNADPAGSSVTCPEAYSSDYKCYVDKTHMYSAHQYNLIFHQVDHSYKILSQAPDNKASYEVYKALESNGQEYDIKVTVGDDGSVNVTTNVGGADIIKGKDGTMYVVSRTIDE